MGIANLSISIIALSAGLLAALAMPAAAGPLPDHVTAAIEGKLQRPKVPGTENLMSAPGTAPAQPRIKLGVNWAADVAAPLVDLGWNYSFASNCFTTETSAGQIVYILNLANGYAIASTDLGDAAYFASACGTAANIAVFVTGVSDNEFDWTTAGFAKP